MTTGSVTTPRPVWRDARLLLAPLALRFPRIIRRFTAAHAVLFLWTRGLLASRWFGTAILVLETVGRRTGKPRAAPIVYLADGENLVVVAANGGANGPPSWWLNLQAAGNAVAVLGRERRPVRPLEATGAERERLWRRFAAVSPVDHYQLRTHRCIPVIVLAPAAVHPPSPSSEGTGRVGGDYELRAAAGLGTDAGRRQRRLLPPSQPRHDERTCPLA
jgi:deazaflavin-dependent oxidoreductase (nitroreductase family)